MNKETSRRDFLKLAGKGMLGAAALSTVPVVMPAVAEGAEAPAWPWAYKKLDKEAVMKHGYECFYSHGGCCAGAAGFRFSFSTRRFRSILSSRFDRAWLNHSS